ncbi:ankyrin repeat protein, partial [Ancylostoma ceylanicum]
HEVTVKVLIDAGSDIEVKNSHEETALDCAVREGRLGAVKVLLDHGALIENKEDVSESIYQQKKPRLAVAPALAKQTLYSRDSTPQRPHTVTVNPYFSHSTALHVAAKNGYDAIVRLLLLRGATIDRRDEDSLTALDLAVMGGYRGVAQALVEADDWQKIMTPKDELPLGRHNEARRTPMRDLISEFPDVAKIVLSKCVEEQGEKSAAYYRVAYDFSLIDDTYMMPSKDGTARKNGLQIVLDR